MYVYGCGRVGKFTYKCEVANRIRVFMVFSFPHSFRLLLLSEVEYGLGQVEKYSLPLDSCHMHFQVINLGLCSF